MTQEHPITPPPELVEQWLCDDNYSYEPFTNATISITSGRLRNIATQAARWGADQELEACCEWLRGSLPGYDKHYADCLHTARRPKPPSLKTQALTLLDDCSDRMDAVHENIIRRALESLPD